MYPIPASPCPSPGIIIIKLPRNDFYCALCGIRIMGVWTLNRHFTTRHRLARVLYMCRGCEKIDMNCHSIACHVPKCKGNKSPVKGGNECYICKKKFRSARGVSQHERHNHPMEWNKDKIEERTRMRGGSSKGRAQETTTDTFLERLNKVAGPQDIEQRQERPNNTGTNLNKTQAPKTAPENERLRGESDEVLSMTGVDNIIAAQIVQEENMRVMSKDNKLEKMAMMVEDTDCQESAETLELVKDMDYDEITIDEVATVMIQAMGTERREPKEQNPRNGDQWQTKGSKRRRIERVNHYKSCQNLYLSDQAMLAKMILDGKENMECTIPMGKVYPTFREKWENGNEFRSLDRFTSTGGVGPDGITKKTLTKPKTLKECRTTLIPKSTDEMELRDIRNWRPVTIGSLVLRLFGRILTMRLTKACPMNPRQRGFLAGAGGCAENLMILDRLIKRARLERKPLAVVLVDFAKAFDSVAHNHILAALKQKGADNLMFDVIKDSYVDCTTRICCGKSRSEVIQMKVGVKQGDPMSPVIQLGHRLINKHTGNECSGLVMGRKENRITGLSEGLVNAEGPWILNGLPIQMVDPGQTVKDLGVQVGPDKGVTAPDVSSKLEQLLVNIKNSDLKPSEPWLLVEALSRTGKFHRRKGSVSRHLYLWVLMGALAAMDRMVRKPVKGWLDLEQSINNGLIYSRNKDGGLGVIKLERMIPALRLKYIWKMCSSDDGWSKCLAREMVGQPSWGTMWKMAGGEECETPKIHEESDDGKAKRRKLNLPDWRLEEIKAWERMSTQGKGVAMFRNDKISNSWIKEPNKASFKQKQYLTLLAMRAGVTPSQDGRLGNSNMPQWWSDFPLEMAAEEKVNKYRPISNLIRKMFGAKRVKIYGFPLGARGKRPTCNNLVLMEIGLSEQRSKTFAKFMSRRVLLYSIDVTQCPHYYSTLQRTHSYNTSKTQIGASE
uniref:C2H2-type domain-containing protein n=1 Tax=Hippocampus comes TaxID=109280 RepID=A0A3Q2XM62_HIPCM